MLLGTQDKDFFPENILEKFIDVKSFGFDCFEIDGKLLVENLQDVKRAIKQTGMPVSSACGGYRGWIGDFVEEKRLTAIEDITKILECLAEVGGRGIVVPAAWGMFSYRLPPMVSPRSKEEDRKVIIDSLSKLDSAAGKYGVNIFLEPLNRYEDHMLNLTADAVSVINEGKFKNVKVTCDFYHMSIEEDDISATLKKYSDYIGHVHIAENHRYQPGTGSIDFKRHIGTLKEIGYDGPIINEGRVRGKDPREAYRTSVKYMRDIMEKLC
jgi:sugar phosphate isomerase/epimerase